MWLVGEDPAAEKGEAGGFSRGLGGAITEIAPLLRLNCIHLSGAHSYSFRTHFIGVDILGGGFNTGSTTIFAQEATYYLTATAVVANPEDPAYLECWQFPTPFKTYPTVGQSLFLGNASNVTYVVLPASRRGRNTQTTSSDVGPSLRSSQFFVLLSGMSQITFPYNNQEAWVMEGVNGFLVANDVKVSAITPHTYLTRDCFVAGTVRRRGCARA
ncbi:hypothetical protein BDZ45DRAFT_741836 [Acephala macrosclerotiorum]|nr:hypothetical protein BDZ45DRAFT_741836 [Acephala macrosclerotiorum]